MNPESGNSHHVASCPGCGSASYKITGATVPGFTCSMGGREFNQPSYAVYECSLCGLLYKNSRTSSAELDAYYAKVDFRKWEVSGYFPTERAALAVLKKLPHRARILDFGCSSGRLLATLTKDYDCCGFEINKEAAASASAKGIKIVCSDFSEKGVVEGFDAVVMVDVFEHLSMPTDLLSKLYQNVKPGGLLIIITGNGDTPACRLDPAHFWYFHNIEHLSMLTRRYADYLSHQLGAAHTYLWEEMSHYNTSIRKRVQQYAQHFAYWQFRHGTTFAKTCLPLIPLLNRAKNWPVAPPLSVGRDHVMLVLSKPK